jgi:hypothetical protein
VSRLIDLRFRWHYGLGQNIAQGPERARFGLMHRSKQLKLFDRSVGAGEQEMRHCELAELARVTGVKLPESNFA